MKVYFYLIVSVLIFVNFSKDVFAVPPPDFLFNIGTSIAQIFSVLVIFLSALFGSAWRFFKIYIYKLKHRKIFFLFMGMIVLVLSFTGSYLISEYKQEQAYKNWISESEKRVDKNNIDYDLDQLKVENNESPNNINSQNSVETKKDLKVEFIKNYYKLINEHNLSQAYELSSKTVSLATYENWYNNIEEVNLDKIQKIDYNDYSLELTLYENDQITRYAVLMTLEDNGQIRIKNSKSRVLDENGNLNPIIPDNGNSKSFYENNKNIDLFVSNREFSKIIESQNIFILDAREDEEYEIGRFPESNHIRFADLLSGQWISLPADKVIYVFCWSGIRGEEVASFLRSKKLISRYIENGADGWVKFGGRWEGGINFSSKYPQEQYKRLVSYDELINYMNQGATIIDSRFNGRYENWHIPGSFNIPIIYTPSSELNKLLNSVPEEKSIITVCDDFVSCFDAKITGLKLEKLGHTFIGRYNKPWEFRNNQKK